MRAGLVDRASSLPHNSLPWADSINTGNAQGGEIMIMFAKGHRLIVSGGLDADAVSRLLFCLVSDSLIRRRRSPSWRGM